MKRDLDEIIKKSLAGDSKSVAELLQSLRPLVLSYSKRYGGRQGVDEDIYQDGLLEILEALRDYDSSKNVPFLGYITVRLRYYYQNQRRKQKTTYSLNQVIGDNEDTTFLDLIEDEDSHVEDIYIQLESNQELMKAIDGLTPLQKKVIQEYYFHKKPLKKIALERSVHHVTVSKTKATALKNLKKVLKISC